MIIMFALALLPVLLTIGGAVDYMRVGRAKSQLQQALDAATLAAATGNTGASALMRTNDTAGSLLSNVSVSWTNNSDGSVTGTATALVPTSFMKLAQINSISVGATATASIGSPQTASNVSFSLTAAYGWYWKQVDIYIHNVGTTGDTKLASYIYQPVNQSALSGRGTGSTTAQFLSGGAMVAGAINSAVTMGSAYDKAYLTMTVYSDGCGPGMVNSSSNSIVSCVSSGTKINGTTYTKTATPVIYSTADATQSRNLFVNGVNMYSPKAAPKIMQILPCAISGTATTTNTHAWEDTPYSGSINTGSWATQDIFFTVQTGCAANANYTGAPKLIR
ncbi:TadE/TadG family type IV pilus assembly protein [Methylocystis heyeri]|uniref:TadE/TadG family type IV pilus assembly protein n=1 Tax=Methylocystis heyeri TaxID=391905 RepID=UPI00138A3A15|nr:pilus assembly protein TadG-related protein [Methylocystis heyeri]